MRVQDDDNLLSVEDQGEGMAKVLMVWTMPVKDAKAMVEVLVEREVVPPKALVARR